MNTHKKLIEEKVVNSQCDAGDVVTGWVIQSDEVRKILQDTIDTVSMIVREEEAVEYNKIIDTALEGMKSDPTLPVDDALYSRSDIDREVDKTLTDILENVVKPLYNKTGDN